MNTKLYIATFNHGAYEEKFYALDDEHASRVAHEIAARRSLMYDMVKEVDGSEGTEPVDCAPWAYPRCTR